ncbi:MAG: SPOR domain-containing protein [Thalassovita sp.]|nr:SPOR domain-containing protein [Thalassovita sp.]
MKLARVIAGATILAWAGIGASEGASLRNTDEPAEFPPASYKGMQYVDSRGCIYVRAGIDGNVTWVPRVTLGRQHICGATPTFAKAVEPKLPVIADRPEPAQEPMAQAAPPPASEPVKVKVAAAAPVADLAPRTAGKPMTTIASIATPPKLIKPVQPAPQARPVKKAAPAPSCQGVSEIGQRYMTGKNMRCGPQDPDPVSANSGRQSSNWVTVPAPAGIPTTTATGGIQTQAYVAPRHVYENQLNASLANPVPEGYRPVWDDDRLNPYRAHQTFAGKAQMDLVWTETVPRQLIDRASGRNVTRLFPNLRYPSTDLTAPPAPKAGVVSTKSQAPVKSAPAPLSGPAYVQVGMFGVPDNAMNTAQRLKQAGLPVRIWTAKRNGRPYQIVVAGPFTSNASAQQALGALRGSGFKDAFLRR